MKNADCIHTVNNERFKMCATSRNLWHGPLIQLLGAKSQ